MKKFLIILIMCLVFTGCSNDCKTDCDECKDKEVEYIKVPVAIKTIQPRTEITKDMLKEIKVPKSSINDNVMTSIDEIIYLYTNINATIPEGSMIYKEVVVEKEELPDSAFVEVPEGQRPYALSVNTASTYGNSIFPGNVIDVYMKAVDENGQIMVGRFLEKVEILAVKDSSGNHVFEDTSTTRTPSTLTFGVPEDVYILLKKAEYLRSYGVEIFPVPYGGTTPVTGNLTVGRQELVDFINSNTVNFYEETDTPIEEEQTGEQ